MTNKPLIRLYHADIIEDANACRGAEPGRVTDNPPPGFGVQGPDPFASPLKSDSVGSGVTEEGEIAAVLGRMLDQAGRMDAQALSQVWAVHNPSLWLHKLLL